MSRRARASPKSRHTRYYNYGIVWRNICSSPMKLPIRSRYARDDAAEHASYYSRHWRDSIAAQLNTRKSRCHNGVRGTHDKALPDEISDVGVAAHFRCGSDAIVEKWPSYVKRRNVRKSISPSLSHAHVVVYMLIRLSSSECAMPQKPSAAKIRKQWRRGNFTPFDNRWHRVFAASCAKSLMSHNAEKY